jgi:hypothetical protein
MRLSRSPQLTAVCKNLRAYRKVDRSTNGRAEVMVSPTIGGKHLVRHRWELTPMHTPGLRRTEVVARHGRTTLLSARWSPIITKMTGLPVQVN